MVIFLCCIYLYFSYFCSAPVLALCLAREYAVSEWRQLLGCSDDIGAEVEGKEEDNEPPTTQGGEATEKKELRLMNNRILMLKLIIIILFLAFVSSLVSQGAMK